MIVETHNNCRDPRRIECTRVVIRDRFENPLVIVISVDDQTQEVYTYKDPEFPRVLQALGIEGVLVVEQLNVGQPTNLPGKLWIP